MLTPVLVCDTAALDANIAAMQALADAGGVALRPHAKGHRSPWIAQRQLAAGACGVAVATAGEARAMLAAGVQDVLLTTLAPPQRAAELVALAAGGALTVVVDTPQGAEALNRAAAAAGVTLPVVLDVDVGQRRGGVRSPERAAAVAEAVLMTGSCLRLRGVQGYDGHLQGVADPAARAAGHAEAMARLQAAVAPVRDLVRRLGAVRPDVGPDLELVTTAGTATAPLAAACFGVTELQPGSYALMDGAYAAVGSAFRQAAYVLTTVTAVVGPGEVIVDAGTRAISTDLGPARVADARGATYEPAGDEHGRVRGAALHLRPGDALRLIPSHTDTTVVLHDGVVPLP